MDDRDFLRDFEASAIPRECWTHAAHVRVAYLYLRQHSFEVALDRLRAGIRALNRANGVRDTPTSGYHETVTVAWARVVVAAIARGPTRDFEAFSACHRELLAGDVLRAHYSKGLIMSPEARATFVEPDLAPLPSVRE